MHTCQTEEAECLLTTTAAHGIRQHTSAMLRIRHPNRCRLNLPSHFPWLQIRSVNQTDRDDCKDTGCTIGGCELLADGPYEEVSHKVLLRARAVAAPLGRAVCLLERAVT